MYVARNTAPHPHPGLGEATLPADIDLGAAEAPALLARLDAEWPLLSPALRDATLRGLRLVVPPPRTHEDGLVVLPGGALALRCGDAGVKVCDPLAAAVLAELPAEALRAALAEVPGVLSVTHEAGGLTTRPGIPAVLPWQSCSLVPQAALLVPYVPDAASWHGSALVQWRTGGAVAWPLVTAPDLLALAAAAGLTLASDAAPVPVSRWDAPDHATRAELLAPAVLDRVDDLLLYDVGDELRWALAERAARTDGVAGRLSQALRCLPAPFGGDRTADVGAELLAAWPRVGLHLSGCDAAPDLVLLGIEAGTSGPAGLQALRDLLDGEGLFFAERAAPDQFVALGSQAARFTARTLAAGERYGVLIAPPAGPLELFALADALARETEGRVMAAAPCWGFYHRLDARDGSEAGNAAWFGMGAGLDELDWL